jgi:hypothetical protein
VERSVKWRAAIVVAIGVSGLCALAETPRRAAATTPEERVKVVVPTATLGMRYDDPWLRAIIIAPRLYGSMTATLYGAPDFAALRMLMDKPTIAVVMSTLSRYHDNWLQRSAPEIASAVLPLTSARRVRSVFMMFPQ